MFWPCFFGVSLVALSFVGPSVVLGRMKPRQSRHWGQWTAFLCSLVPGAFLLACFGVSEIQQALFVGKMERIDLGWSSSQVERLLDSPDHIFEPGKLVQGGRSYGPTNRSVVWSYTPPREHALLRGTPEFPFIRFRSSLDTFWEGMVGGIFGVGAGSCILQLGSDDRVIRKGSFE